MLSYPSLQIFLAIALVSSLFYPSSATATVITVDTYGKYQVDEIKDFRRRSVANSGVSANITRTSLDLGTTSEPFIARIIPSPEKFSPSAENNGKSTAINKPIVSNSPYEAIIRDAAQQNAKLDVALIKAVIAVESNYNATAISPKGAMGLMQLMPATAERHGVTNPFDPSQNIQAGASELNMLMENNANISLALAAYNAGQGAVTKYKGIPPYKETQNYVVKVLTKTFHDRRNADHEKNKPIEKTKPAENNSKKNRLMKVYTYDW